MRAVFQCVGETPVGMLMRDSTWGFATVETIHLLGLAVLGGAVLVINLAALSILFRRNDSVVIASAAAPALVGSLVVMLVSGALLVVSKPVRYYLDPTFRVKMLLLLLAAIASWVTHRTLRPGAPPSTATHIAAAASLLLWFGVALCGRMIGFL